MVVGNAAVVVFHQNNNTIRSMNCDVVDRFGIMITGVINKCNGQTRLDIVWNISASGLHVYLLFGQYRFCSIYFIIRNTVSIAI